MEFKELDQFLLARAMKHDSPSLLFELACEQLRSSRLIRPGPVWLVERVATARAAAKAETFTRLEHLLTPQLMTDLDRLLVVDDELGGTRLHWVGTGATQASPEAIKAEIGKLRFLRGIGADEIELSVLPAERRRFLAGVGRRSTAQMLSRRDPERRYPILLTLVSQSAVEVLDAVSFHGSDAAGDLIAAGGCAAGVVCEGHPQCAGRCPDVVCAGPLARLPRADPDGG